MHRPTVGRYIGRPSVDYRSIAGRLSTGISFCFWATYLGSEKPTSGKNLSSGSVCTVGKLSSVDVHVTSTVLTELGIHGPTSVFKLCRGCDLSLVLLHNGARFVNNVYGNNRPKNTVHGPARFKNLFNTHLGI